MPEVETKWGEVKILAKMPEYIKSSPFDKWINDAKAKVVEVTVPNPEKYPDINRRASMIRSRIAKLGLNKEISVEVGESAVYLHPRRRLVG